MRLSQSTRNRMIATTQEMLNRLEILCQNEYDRIIYLQGQIEKSQHLLNERLEPEYLKCDELLKNLKTKYNKAN